MLDVGFSEILLTSAIALIVLGPEKLPKVARQVGTWMGRARAMARQLTEQLEREVSADELMKQQTKPKANPAGAGISSDPAPFDTSAYVPAPVIAPAEAVVSHQSVAPSDATAAAAVAAEPAVAAAADVYAPNAGVAPQGADWHPAPPDSKPGNG
jgi:Tat protein translocase TatB subunit